jgi:hypothetical protein
LYVSRDSVYHVPPASTLTPVNGNRKSWNTISAQYRWLLYFHRYVMLPVALFLFLSATGHSTIVQYTGGLSVNPPVMVL